MAGLRKERGDAQDTNGVKIQNFLPLFADFIQLVAFLFLSDHDQTSRITSVSQ